MARFHRQQRCRKVALHHTPAYGPAHIGAVHVRAGDYGKYHAKERLDVAAFVVRHHDADGRLNAHAAVVLCFNVALAVIAGHAGIVPGDEARMFGIDGDPLVIPRVLMPPYGFCRSINSPCSGKAGVLRASLCRPRSSSGQSDFTCALYGPLRG